MINTILYYIFEAIFTLLLLVFFVGGIYLILNSLVQFHKDGMERVRKGEEDKD